MLLILFRRFSCSKGYISMGFTVLACFDLSLTWGNGMYDPRKNTRQQRLEQSLGASGTGGEG